MEINAGSLGEICKDLYPTTAACTRNVCRGLCRNSKVFQQLIGAICSSKNLCQCIGTCPYI